MTNVRLQTDHSQVAISFCSTVSFAGHPAGCYTLIIHNPRHFLQYRIRIRVTNKRHCKHSQPATFLAVQCQFQSVQHVITLSSCMIRDVFCSTGSVPKSSACRVSRTTPKIPDNQSPALGAKAQRECCLSHRERRTLPHRRGGASRLCMMSFMRMHFQVCRARPLSFTSFCHSPKPQNLNQFDRLLTERIKALHDLLHANALSILCGRLRQHAVSMSEMLRVGGHGCSYLQNSCTIDTDTIAILARDLTIG